MVLHELDESLVLEFRSWQDGRWKSSYRILNDRVFLILLER